MRKYIRNYISISYIRKYLSCTKMRKKKNRLKNTWRYIKEYIHVGMYE